MRLSSPLAAGLPLLTLSFVVVTASESRARADELPGVDVGFFVQPQFKMQQNSPVSDDEDGFAVRRTRVQLHAGRDLGCAKIDFRAEVELLPDFTAQDSYLTLSGPLQFGAYSVSLGQFKAPFSRQTLVSDSRLQFVDKAQITSLAPDRQVGAAGTLTLPRSELSFGLFNGEGKNITDNADENYMYVGRATFRPFDEHAKLAESGMQGLQLEISGSAAYNTIDRGDYDQTVKYFGVDGFAAWEGASLAFEWLEARTSYSKGAPAMKFKANGFYAQGGYLLPLPGWAYRRFEVAARVEEVDRNDELPIAQPGNSEQSLRYYTLGASYYHFGHDLKLQLQASHIQEIEDKTGGGMNATFDNDTVLVQITYRQ